MTTVIPIRILMVIAAALFSQNSAIDSSSLGEPASVETPLASVETPLASATVGAPRVIADIILPGTELVAKPIAGDPEMIVQVIDAIPHGDAYRYTIRFSGLEPGPHDLADWLARKDGSELGELPAIPIAIESLLPAGQVTPNQLPEGWIPGMGGYKVFMGIAATVWGLILLALIFAGRGKKQKVETAGPPTHSLADLLKERLDAGLENKVTPQQYAELERMLFSMWRKRLGYESLPLEDAMAKIKSNSQAGPLMVQLENWMHRPESDNQNVDLPKLLEPYRDLSAEELEAAG